MGETKNAGPYQFIDVAAIAATRDKICELLVLCCCSSSLDFFNGSPRSNR